MLLHPEIPDTRVTEIFDKLGPTPRLCSGILKDPVLLKHYEHVLDRTISNLTIGRLERLRYSAPLALDSLSRKICLISREDPDVVQSLYVLALATNFIAFRLAAQFRNLEQREQIRLYHRLEWHPQSRPVAGAIYDAMVLSRLQGGMPLELIPMVKLDASGKGKAQRPRWHSSHMCIHDEALEESRRHALTKRFLVEIQPTETFEYTDDKLEPIRPNVLYIPKVTNQTAIDSFILVDGFFFLFQISIASTHVINPRLIDVAKKLNIPEMDKWRFVFIIPPDLTLVVPPPWRGPLRNLSLYSAVVNPDDPFGSVLYYRHNSS